MTFRLIGIPSHLIFSAFLAITTNLTGCITAHEFGDEFADDVAQCPELMLWAHRGLSLELAENSIEAHKAAAATGFCGTEVDVFFINDELFITHDEPKTTEGLAKLDELFQELAPTGVFVWVDFKNLEVPNVAKAAALMEKLITKHKMRGRVFVESSNWYALSSMKELSKDIRTIVWFTKSFGLINPTKEAKIDDQTRKNVEKQFEIFKYDRMSGPIDLFKRSASYKNPDVGLHSWNYNTDEDIEFAIDQEFRVVLTDKSIKPAWHKFSCKDISYAGKGPICFY